MNGREGIADGAVVVEEVVVEIVHVVIKVRVGAKVGIILKLGLVVAEGHSYLTGSQKEKPFYRI